MKLKNLTVLHEVQAPFDTQREEEDQGSVVAHTRQKKELKRGVVYRGIAGGKPPKEFSENNEQGFKGGVDIACPTRIEFATLPFLSFFASLSGALPYRKVTPHGFV